MRRLFVLLFLTAGFGVVFPQETAPVAEGESFTIERPADEAEKPAADSAVMPADNAGERLAVKSGAELRARHSAWLPFSSLLLPGLAEYRLGQKKLAKTLMVSDGLLWIGLAASFAYRSARLDDLRAFLYTYGACDGRHAESGRNAWDLSEDEMEFALYVDSSAYYEERVFKPSRDPLMQRIDFYWNWSSEASHQTYYDMWKQRNAAKVYGYYFLGTAVVLRVASFIHARYAAKNEKAADAAGRARFDWQAVPVLVNRTAPGALLYVQF